MQETSTADNGGKSLSRDIPTMRLHLWFETPEGVLFGLGRLQLLRQVESCGSLKAAAEKLGMSYRGAWGKIKATEELMGEKLIERASCRRSGYRLTPFGSDMARSFDQWYQEVERFALSKSQEFLPFSLNKFE
jgi:molybdate transport system regulatory protein